MTCGLCHSPTRDKAYVCDPCGDSYATDLKDLVGWLADDLETSVGGAKGVRYQAGNTTGGGDSDLRVNWRAAKVTRDLEKALTNAVDHCAATARRRDDRPPAPTAAGMARWLAWRVDGLCLDIAGPDLMRPIIRQAQRARELVFWKPPERHYLGECEVCGTGSVYAEGKDEQALCDRCEKAFPAEARRSNLLQALDDRLVTAAEAAHLSTYLDLRADRVRVGNLVRQWAKRGRLVAHGGDGSRYRFGEILTLIRAQEASDQGHTAATMQRHS